MLLGVPLIAITPSQLSVALKELVNEFRIEIWAFNNIRHCWKVTCRASPGNVEQIESFLGEEHCTSSANPVIASISMHMVEGDRKIGFATVDVGRMRIGWTSFVDSGLLCNLEAALVQVGARECIYPKGWTEVESLLADGHEIVGTAIPSTEFTHEHTLYDLKRLLSASSNFGEIPVETQMSLGAAIKYLGLLAADTNLEMFSLEQINLHRYMRLDETALKSLNVFGPSGSLFKILDKCKTRQGTRLLSQWLRQPLLDIDELRLRHEIVAALITSSVERQNLRDNILRGVPDIFRVTRRLVKGNANLQDLVLLYTAIAKVAPIHDCLLPIESPAVQTIFIQSLCRSSIQLSKYADLIEAMVDFSALRRHEYIIRADFHPDLSVLNSRREMLLDEIEQEFDRVVRLVGLEKGKKIKLERNPTYGYYFRVSRLEASIVKREEYKFHELAALKNGIYFVSNTLREQSLQYDQLGKEYSAQQSTLVQEMIKIAQTYRKPFEELDDLLARIDVLQSLAYAAIVAPVEYTRPLMMSENETGMRIKGMRHACLETVTSFIANDVSFSSENSLQIITGPNMGGKSTFIRSIALLVLMAQIGSFVPCQSAHLPITDAILVRVGAGDSILRGISTFMAEMLETASILDTATPRSLVVIDELGRGTSTSEGFGLAWAVAKQLAELGCPTLFATHFHELTSLANAVPRVTNLYTEAIVDQGRQLMMTFRIHPGTCDKSYGIQCAQMAGFPARVLQIARIILKDLQGNLCSQEEVTECLGFIEQLQNSKDLQSSLPPFIEAILNH